MRDFTAHVRRHLIPLGIPEEQQSKIVDELAEELEARYTALIQDGATDREAWEAVLAQIPSWQALATALTGATTTSRRWSASRTSRLFPPGAGGRLAHDVRIAARVLWKDRGFAATATVTLALCIAGNTAIFASVRAILLNGLRVPAPSEVVLMANQYPREGTGRPSVVSSPPDYDDRRRFVTSLAEQAMYAGAAETIELAGVPARVRGMSTTSGLFPLLGIPPAVGRTFTEAETVRGNEHYIVLSDGLWSELYGRDSAAIGRTLRVTGRPFTVIGVMPPEFSFDNPAIRFWIPLVFSDRQRSDDARHSNGWFNIGRLKPGATIAQVRDELDRLNETNLNRFPEFAEILKSTGFYTSVEPLQDVRVRDVRRTLYLLWGAAIVVLAIGVGNVGNLALARSRLRFRELGTRLAIGAGRSDIVRTYLVEGSVIALAAGLAGLLLGAWTLSVLELAGLSILRDAPVIRVDAVVVTVMLIVSAGVGVLIGLVSALPLVNVTVGAMLQDETRSGQSRHARGVRRALVVSQMACSFMLLVSAVLLWASLRNVLAVDPGYDLDGVVTALSGLPGERYSPDDVRGFTNRSLEAIRRLPGVVAAGATTTVPLCCNYASGLIVAEGYVPKPGEPPVTGIRALVTPGYFEAIGTPLVRGRYFDESDNTAGTRSIVIDERLARRFWPDADPVGRRMFRPTTPAELLTPPPDTRWLTVVGVVREAQLRALATGETLSGTYYLPAAVTAPRDIGFVVRTSGDPVAIVRELRSTVANVDREAVLFDIRTMSERADLSVLTRVTTLRLTAIFAAVALALAAVGLYGTLAYTVTQRLREIGVRMAIGSTPAAIIAMVLREGLVLAMGGIALGWIGALGLRHVIASQLHGVGASDAGIMTAAALAIASIAAAACLLPARRASRVDILTVLSSS
jgi:predicted permease